jgi:hypothetical protein
VGTFLSIRKLLRIHTEVLRSTGIDHHDVAERMQYKMGRAAHRSGVIGGHDSTPRPDDPIEIGERSLYVHPAAIGANRSTDRSPPVLDAGYSQRQKPRLN